MLKLIINADDFGLSESVNNGVRRAHQHGVLTSASIMANGRAFDHAAAVCNELPSLGVGVHLTLVEERPILDPATIPSLVTSAGVFHPHVTTFTRLYLQGKIRLEEVERELEAQVALVRSRGIVPSHVDSHQHVHMLPGVLRVATALAARHAVSCMRFPAESVSAYMLRGAGAASRVAQLLALRTFCYIGRAADITRTDHFAGFFFGGRLNAANFATVIAHLPATGTCEIMCHPGEPDPDTRYAHWHYDGPAELNAMLDAECAELLRRRGASLVSWRDLR